ncbi:hypothetical protein B0H13DRAFT_1850153 [Mycena leptocephala]|nr:hypothetical protein B0H13DRAFT_1850153 [Mycena leptocephala]
MNTYTDPHHPVEPANRDRAPVDNWEIHAEDPIADYNRYPPPPSLLQTTTVINARSISAVCSWLHAHRTWKPVSASSERNITKVELKTGYGFVEFDTYMAANKNVRVEFALGRGRRIKRVPQRLRYSEILATRNFVRPEAPPTQEMALRGAPASGADGRYDHDHLGITRGVTHSVRGITKVLHLLDFKSTCLTDFVYRRDSTSPFNTSCKNSALGAVSRSGDPGSPGVRRSQTATSQDSGQQTADQVCRGGEQRCDENASFCECEIRYKACERTRTESLLQQANEREQAVTKAIRMYEQLDAWDDDESRDSFYTARLRWREERKQALAEEQTADIANLAL